MVGLHQLSHFGSKARIVIGAFYFHFTFHKIALGIHFRPFDIEHNALGTGKFWVLLNV